MKTVNNILSVPFFINLRPYILCEIYIPYIYVKPVETGFLYTELRVHSWNNAAAAILIYDTNNKTLQCLQNALI